MHWWPELRLGPQVASVFVTEGIVSMEKKTGDQKDQETRPFVLDVCCGSRMFWFDKADHRALFVDKRRETVVDHTGKRPAEIVVDPDVLADFRKLPFSDEQFALVVFDPPHTFCGPNGRTIKKYGTLPPDWREMISLGFAECFRVLCPKGTLVFKWNEHRVKLWTVLALTDRVPLFGQKVGNTRTHWLVFVKD